MGCLFHHFVGFGGGDIDPPVFSVDDHVRLRGLSYLDDMKIHVFGTGGERKNDAVGAFVVPADAVYFRSVTYSDTNRTTRMRGIRP